MLMLKRGTMKTTGMICRRGIILQARQSNSHIRSSFLPDVAGTPVHLVRAPKTSKRQVPLELLHVRLGHRPNKSLLAGSDLGIWDDVVAIPAPDTFCLPCKMASIRSANRGQGRTAHATKAGQVFIC